MAENKSTLMRELWGWLTVLTTDVYVFLSLCRIQRNVVSLEVLSQVGSFCPTPNKGILHADRLMIYRHL